MSDLDRLEAENHDLRMSVWLHGSRLNCLLLDAPPLPPRSAFKDNSEYLRTCERAIDQHMQSVIALQGRKA